MLEGRGRRPKEEDEGVLFSFIDFSNVREQILTVISTYYVISQNMNKHLSQYFKH